MGDCLFSGSLSLLPLWNFRIKGAGKKSNNTISENAGGFVSDGLLRSVDRCASDRIIEYGLRSEPVPQDLFVTKPTQMKMHQAMSPRFATWARTRFLNDHVVWQANYAENVEPYTPDCRLQTPALLKELKKERSWNGVHELSARIWLIWSKKFDFQAAPQKSAL